MDDKLLFTLLDSQMSMPCPKWVKNLVAIKVDIRNVQFASTQQRFSFFRNRLSLFSKTSMYSRLARCRLHKSCQEYCPNDFASDSQKEKNKQKHISIILFRCLLSWIISDRIEHSTAVHVFDTDLKEVYYTKNGIPSDTALTNTEWWTNGNVNSIKKLFQIWSGMMRLFNPYSRAIVI
jgi:hypothetical protein